MNGDLISRSALKERWTIASPEPYTTDAAEVLASIDEAPAVDAVVPVRCKDCKHRTEYFDSGMYVCKHEQCPVCGKAAFVADDHFCGYGERRVDK